MKSLFAIALIAVFAIHSCFKTVIIIDYYLNKNYIANNLCENKNKTEMHCEGKCHLQKQLNKEEQKEQKLPNIFKEKVEISCVVQLDPGSFIYDFKIIELHENSLIKEYASGLKDIFHPPPAILIYKA